MISRYDIVSMHAHDVGSQRLASADCDSVLVQEHVKKTVREAKKANREVSYGIC